MYADFDYYSKEYYDLLTEPVIPNVDRIRYLKRSSAMLKNLFCREPDIPYSESLKTACCEVADLLYKTDLTANIASESNDGYSVSYKADSETAVQNKVCEIASIYLGDSGILYRGLI